MALIKKTNFKGIDAEYWKIITLIEDFITNKTKVIMGLYVSRQARLINGINFVKRETFEIEDIDLDREQTYEKLRELAAFEGAQDILEFA